MTDYLHALPPGYRIEEYELVRVLGSGGFGITYLGYDHHLDKAVAIKEYLPNDLAVRTDNNSVLPKSTQDKADYEWGLARFLNEAQTLARFDHRHIIKIHRFFRAHGTGYSVMEYAEGETLSEVLQRKGTLTESELKQLLFPILDGLEAVHEADFLHRDIKPGNIVIRDDGSPVLIDFGSARQAVAGKSRSVTAIVTPGYAPIEQYSAKGHQGPWTDIYGLGAVCYRCLTGAPPDDATERLREDPLVSASKRCKGKASAALLNAIDRALRVDEGERPQRIAEWRQALDGDGKSRKHTTSSVHQPVTRPAKGSTKAHTGMNWSSMALVLVIVVLLGASVWQGWQLYRGAPSDGVGETVAVVEQQADVALGTQKDNEVEAAPGTAGKGTGQPAAEPEASAPAEKEDIQKIGDPNITDAFDILWGISGRSDDPDEKERLKQAVLDMTPEKRGGWYTGVQAITRQLTLNIQNLLTALGYNPGTADGVYGERTKLAIEAFQQDIGISVDGQISRQLLHTLRQELVARQGENAGITDTTLITQKNPSRLSGSQEEYFTRGSHEDDVLRLQGTPSSRFSRDEVWGGYERLCFETGYTTSSTTANDLMRYIIETGIGCGFGSEVQIDLQTRRVVAWDNQGNLKVRLLPGKQVSSESYFTRGSHQDDVLRLQGTPSKINRWYEGAGFEGWWFDTSTVKIDLRTRRVLAWSDISRSLKVRLLPGNQVTIKTYFTRGSHEDDVLRLQGTPSIISQDKTWDYEIWDFGTLSVPAREPTTWEEVVRHDWGMRRSTVKIDLRTRRVLEWTNIDGNLKVKP